MHRQDGIPFARVFDGGTCMEDYKQVRLTEGASNNTVNHELTNLSHMLRLAIQWRYIDKNVVSNVERMRVSEKPKRYLTQERIQRLTEAAKGSYICPLIMTALHTGMRKSELLNLKWTDICRFPKITIH